MYIEYAYTIYTYTFSNKKLTRSVYASFFPVLIHELGHAFAAQLTGGQVQDIRMVMSAKKQEVTGKQGYTLIIQNKLLNL